VEDPALFSGVPLAVLNLKNAATELSGAAPPEIGHRLLRQLDVVAQANDKAAAAWDAGSGLLANPSLIRELEQVRVLTDAFRQPLDRLGGWHALGTVMAEHIRDCNDPATNDKSQLMVCVVAARLPSREQKRVRAIAELAKRGGETSPHLAEIQRTFAARFGGDGVSPPPPPMGRNAVRSKSGGDKSSDQNGSSDRTVGDRPNETESSQPERVRLERWWRLHTPQRVRDAFAVHLHVSDHLRHLVKTPYWNPDGTVFEYDGQRVGIVQPNAYSARPILDKFENEGWPLLLSYPFENAVDKSNALTSLNRIGGKRVVFSGGGRLGTLRWSPGGN